MSRRIGAIGPLIAGAFLALGSTPAVAQGWFEWHPPPSVADLPVGVTMMRTVPYPEDTVVPYACYRVGRCSVDDLLRFRDRPNRLTRLAPEPPAMSVAAEYTWTFVPVTPEENILPKYRTSSQVREAYRAVGTPIDGRDASK